MQTTLIILKPDCVQRGLMGQVLQRFERKGLKVIGAKFMQVTEELARKHYAEHVEKPFFPSLQAFITSAPVMVMAVRGPEAIAVCRNVIGSTDGKQADLGTIRGDFGISKSTNLVHGSDSPESAQRELALWFGEGDITDWTRTNEKWIDG